MKNDLTGSVSTYILQKTPAYSAVQTVVLQCHKSAYQLYLESKHRSLPVTNEQLTPDELKAIFKTFRFQTYPGKSKEDRNLIYDALVLINKKSPTGRLILKQIPPNVLIDTQQSTGNTMGSSYPYRQISLNHQIMQKSLLPVFCGTFLHEISHVIDYELNRQLNPQLLGYYTPQGEPLSFYSKKNQLSPQQQFILEYLQEAEQRARQLQIIGELCSFANLTWHFVKNIISIPFFLIQQKKQTALQKEEHIHHLLKESYSSAIFPKMRSLFYKWRYKLGIDKIPATANPTKADIQEATAKKAIAATIKDFITSPTRYSKIALGLNLPSIGGAILAPFYPAFITIPVGAISALLLTARHELTIKTWQEAYNEDSFKLTRMNQVKQDNKLDVYFKSYLLSLCDKYNNHLTLQNIEQISTTQQAAHQKTFKAWEKLNTLDPQVFRELTVFATIQKIFRLIEEEKKNPDNLNLQTMSLKFHAADVLIAEEIYDAALQKTQETPDTTIEAEIRKHMVQAILKGEAKAAISETSSYNMLKVSQDTEMLTLLAHYEILYPSSKTGLKKLSRKINRLKDEKGKERAKAIKNHQIKKAQQLSLEYFLLLSVCRKQFRKNATEKQKEQRSSSPEKYNRPTVKPIKIKKNILQRRSPKHTREA